MTTRKITIDILFTGMLLLFSFGAHAQDNWLCT
jgi:hypothetical protein